MMWPVLVFDGLIAAFRGRYVRSLTARMRPDTSHVLFSLAFISFHFCILSQDNLLVSLSKWQFRTPVRGHPLCLIFLYLALPF